MCVCVCGCGCGCTRVMSGVEKGLVEGARRNGALADDINTRAVVTVPVYDSCLRNTVVLFVGATAVRTPVTSPRGNPRSLEDALVSEVGEVALARKEWKLIHGHLVVGKQSKNDARKGKEGMKKTTESTHRSFGTEPTLNH